jgi:1,4-alpha-glucan branching enzyme
MPTKRGTKPKTVQVTFILPASVDAQQVALSGEINDWSANGIKLSHNHDQHWRTTLDLEPGRSYRYRHLLDGHRWENAWDANRYVPNPYGSGDSIIVVPE